MAEKPPGLDTPRLVVGVLLAAFLMLIFSTVPAQ